jgi:hypothetical protein
MLLRTYTPVAKSIARYTALGSPAEHCGICRFYAAPNICARVLGPVVPAGWCKFFSKEAVFRPLWPYAGAGTPSLDMSFMTPGAMPSGVTFTRASTAKYFDVSGTMQTAAANAPRWDYNPTSHALNGLLIEEARTNLLLYSGDLSNAGAWTVAGITSVAPTVTANQTAAPDGTVTAARLVFPAVSAAGGASIDFQQPTMTAVPYTFSVYLKGNVGGEQLYLIAENGTASVFYNLRVTLTTAWQRFTLTTPALTAAAWTFAIGADRRDGTQTSIAAQTIFAWGAQVEAGAFPTSYIPTTTAAVTRAADAATMPVGAWYNPSAGSARTTFANVAQPSGGALNALFEFDDGTVNNSIWSMAYGTPGVFTPITQATVAGAATGYLNNGGVSMTPIIKQASAWSVGASLQQTANGGAVQSVALTTLPTVTRLALGSGATGALAPLNGCLRQFSYWPRVLTNTELQSVTT